MEKLGVEVDVKIHRSFHFGTIVGGLNILLQAGIKVTKLKKNMNLNPIFRSLQKLKMFLFESIL